MDEEPSSSSVAQQTNRLSIRPVVVAAHDPSSQPIVRFGRMVWPRFCCVVVGRSASGAAALMSEIMQKSDSHDHRITTGRCACDCV